LEAGSWLGILGSIGDKIVELGFEVGDQPATQLTHANAGSPTQARCACKVF
jgi:hypothetical protein